MIALNPIERIKAHHPGLRKDADVRVLSGHAPAQIKQADGRRELLVIANTARIDLESEVVVPEGGRLGYFGENRSVFFDHQYDDASFIGKVRTGYPVLKDGMMWHVLFGVRRSERGDQLLRDAEDFDVSVSIGFDAIDVGPPTDEEIEKYGAGKRFASIVRKWDWVELSVTWIPCNPEARSARPAVETPKRWTLTPFGVMG